MIGGTLPAALAADWLVSAWDQNSGMRYATPAIAAIEEGAGHWLLQLLGLPRLGLRYLGLGLPTAVPADAQGRLIPGELDRLLSEGTGPALVCLQAGNLYSGAFDPFDDAIRVARSHGAWVHIDGAFGLWAAAVPEFAHLTAGMEAADSWGTDAHKTLNVPYDCGIAVVKDSVALRSAMGLTTSYLVQDAEGPGDPFQKVPELSRRGRGVPVWAALRSLGRAGVAAQVRGLAEAASSIAERLDQVDGIEVLNPVDYTQVSLAFGEDATTRAVTARVIGDGKVWMSGSRWHGRDVLRVSVSNWSTDADDVGAAVDAVSSAFAAVRAESG